MVRLSVSLIFAMVSLAVFSAEALEFRTSSKHQRVIEGPFQQRKDHFSSSKETFQQRYFVIGDYATQGELSPVLFYMCAQYACSADLVPNGPLLLAKSLGAWIVGLEHRFRGISQPEIDMSVSAFRTLNLAQVMRDLNSFQKTVIAKVGLRGSWFAYGASYGGMLAAFYRSQYPDMVDAAVVSSAPLVTSSHADFDRHAKGLIGETCRIKLRNSLSMIGREDLNFVYAHLSEQGVDYGGVELRDIVFFYSWMLAGTFTTGSAQNTCEKLRSDASLSSIKAGLQGAGVSALDGGYSRLVEEFDISTVRNDLRKSHGSRQWDWQRCTELGMFHVNSGDGVLPPTMNLDAHLRKCNRKFGVTQLPDRDVTLRPYLQKYINGTEDRTLFINYKKDPWYLSQFNTENLQRYATTKGLPFVQPKTTSIDLDEGRHSQDFEGRPEDQALRQKIVDWLRHTLKLGTG